MTPAHIFFIPSVFFLGFLLGGIFASRSKGQARAIQDGGPTGQTLAIALMVFAVIFVATHVSPQFGGSKAITVVTHGMPILDQRPSFSVRPGNLWVDFDGFLWPAAEFTITTYLMARAQWTSHLPTGRACGQPLRGA